MTVTRRTVIAAPGGIIARKPPGAMGRACPRCPAEPYASCRKWIRESGNRGRWERCGMHASRTCPGSRDAGVRQFIDAPRATCERPPEHGFHWIGTAWCRGKVAR